MSSDPRLRARTLAAESQARGDAVGWFEALYRDGGTVPWDDGAVNPHLRDALEGVDLHGLRALDVGCGTGDNAAWLASRGALVTAFDVSPTAVEVARQRYPDAGVAWAVADVRDPPRAWLGAFDLVVEVYTLQVLPPEVRPAATAGIAACVAGRLVVAARVREPADPIGTMPWPLLQSEVRAFEAHGLALTGVRATEDDARREIATFVRPDPVRAVLDAQVAAWNAGDVDGFCAHCADDVVYVTTAGEVRGRRALAEAYRAKYPDRSAMGTLSLDLRSLARDPRSATAVVAWSVGPAGGLALLRLAPGADGVWRLTHDATVRT